MKIKKAVIFGLLTVFLALAVTACPDSDSSGDEANYDNTSLITYSAVQTGGESEKADSTGIVFEFSRSIDSLELTEANISIGGRAEKSSAVLTGSGKTWTLSPIKVNAPGLATVKITIDRTDDTETDDTEIIDDIEAVTKNVSVHKNGLPTPKVITIRWHFNGGTAGTGPYTTEIEEGETLAEPSEPKRGDDQFDGWFTNSGLAQGYEYDFAISVTENLNLFAKWIRAPGIPADGGTLAAKLAWVNEHGESGKTYTIEVNGNEELPLTTLFYPNRSGIALIMKGVGGECIISIRDSTGSLFIIENGVALVLESNITLKGGDSGSGSLVRVNSGGTLEIETGAKIAENKTFSSTFVTYGGGVFVNGGTLTMNGGEISGNEASSESPFGSFGGGVYVGSGTFIMNNGTITGNKADRGGGVFVSSSGTFNRYSGDISGNNPEDVVDLNNEANNR